MTGTEPVGFHPMDWARLIPQSEKGPNVRGAEILR